MYRQLLNWKSLMATESDRPLIIAYWFRILISESIGIDNISSIISNFAEEYEHFESSLVHEEIMIEDEGETLLNKPEISHSRRSAFGSIIAKPGNKYHWKVHVVSGCSSINIGVIEADEAHKNVDKYWWNQGYGYSYFQVGLLFNGYLDENDDPSYGGYISDDDIIDVWLDLKDHYQLSFAKNDENYGKAFDMKQNMDYRFSVGFATNTIEMHLVQCKSYK